MFPEISCTQSLRKQTAAQRCGLFPVFPVFPEIFYRGVVLFFQWQWWHWWQPRYDAVCRPWSVTTFYFLSPLLSPDFYNQAVRKNAMMKVFAAAVTTVTTNFYKGIVFYSRWYSGKWFWWNYRILKIASTELWYPNSACRGKSPDPCERLMPWFFCEKYSVEVIKNIPDGRKGALIYHKCGNARFLRKRE